LNVAVEELKVEPGVGLLISALAPPLPFVFVTEKAAAAADMTSMKTRVNTDVKHKI
jgi:hypothetical protein